VLLWISHFLALTRVVETGEGASKSRGLPDLRLFPFSSTFSTHLLSSL